MKRTEMVCTVAVVSVLWAAGFLAGAAGAAEASSRPLIQIALLLDTSNSMDGLIDQAKTQLWRIVNEFAKSKQNGLTPELQVALYEYGKSTLPLSEGYIRKILPLTTDLDKVSEELFGLRTRGGDEYCGMVIQRATEGLMWNPSNSHYKAIFIAGNEPFTQGGVDYQSACKAAIAKGIIVNTIFCGPYPLGVSTDWEKGATLADGKYINIDQNAKVVHIPAPQDAEIARLGETLNTTYVRYGTLGRVAGERQRVQDQNAASAPGGGVERHVAKASAQYRNASWDLVDAVNDKKVDLSSAKAEDLPEELRRMTPEQRNAYVEAKARQRQEVQQKIKQLNQDREKYVAEEMKKRAAGGTDTLDSAVIKIVRTQANARQFVFER